MKVFVLATALAYSIPSFASAPASSCVDPKDRDEWRAQYFLNGGVTPPCIGTCAETFIFDQLCDGKQLKPNCYTTVGMELKLKSYSGPMPACDGRACARELVLEKLCPNL